MKQPLEQRPQLMIFKITTTTKKNPTFRFKTCCVLDKCVCVFFFIILFNTLVVNYAVLCLIIVGPPRAQISARC